ncbi:hypothetical protein [Citrobacter phage Ci1]|nr:hypothetical protein [Citrobacter phage Ci1]
MKITDAFEKFRNYFNFVQPESLFELETLDLSQIDKTLHGNTNRMYTDLLKQHIRIGDIVSYSKIGSYKSISVGVVLGFTDGGYRVARFYKDPQVDYFYCSEIQTPGIVTVVRQNRT